MNFKRHIVLDIDYKGKHRPYPDVRIRVRKGITAEDMTNELADDWEPDKKDRLYFFPGCTVPRFKVREKFNTTIKPEYATAAFISPTTLKGSDNMFDAITRARTIDGNYMLDWFEAIYGEDHHFVIKYKSILLNCEPNVIIHDDHWYKFRHSCPSDARYDPMTIQKWRIENHFEDYSNMDIPVSEITSFYSPVKDSALNDLTCSIYPQDAILRILNEDNLVINNKKYEELRLMANSEDDENIILVMELMANANYKESFVYLLLLLQEFNSKITSRTKEINHVNFKSLLHFLDLDERKIHNITIEMLMTGMKKHKQFTRANLQRVSQFFVAQELPNGGHITGVTDTAHFTTGPVLRPEYNNELDDFVLEEEPEPETDENFNL
jgi:hypothetical protein